MRARVTIAFTCAVLLSVIAPAFAQDRRDPFAESIIAIRCKHIETISHGTINGGVIVIRGGKITQVGADVKPPVGALLLHADTVMPGIVGAYSQMGISNAAGTVARSEPHLRVADELYPWDEIYRRLLRTGVTTLALFPTGRGIPGQGAVVKTCCDSADKMPLASNGPLAIDFAPNTQTIDLIRTTLQGARPAPPGTPPAAASARTAAPTEPLAQDEEQIRGQRRRQPGAGPRATTSSAPPDVRRAPVVRAVMGETPTIVVCPDAASAGYLLPLLQPFTTMKPAYVIGSADSFKAVDAFGAAKASVIVPALISIEPLTRNRINLPAILSKAGAKLALRPSDDSPEGYASLRSQLAELVRNGLSRDTALRAVTLSPAEMLGASDRVGSIDVGRDGNLILLDGDPLEATARVRTVLLEGKRVFEE